MGLMYFSEKSPLGPQPDLVCVHATLVDTQWYCSPHKASVLVDVCIQVPVRQRPHMAGFGTASLIDKFKF